MYSQGTFNITFEQLDTNKNGRIDPGEIDESLKDQIKHRSIKGNCNYSKMKLINLSSSYKLKSSNHTFFEYLHIHNFRGKEKDGFTSYQGVKLHMVPIIVQNELKHYK